MPGGSSFLRWESHRINQSPNIRLQSTFLEYTLHHDCAVFVDEVKSTLKGLAQTTLQGEALVAAFDTESVLAVTFLALVTAVNEHAVVYPTNKSAFVYGSAEIWPLTENDPVRV